MGPTVPSRSRADYPERPLADTIVERRRCAHYLSIERNGELPAMAGDAQPLHSLDRHHVVVARSSQQRAHARGNEPTARLVAHHEHEQSPVIEPLALPRSAD